MAEDDGWRLIGTVQSGARVIVFNPKADPPVFEAKAYPDGEYSDPVYSEWFGSGATHWRPMPDPPTR